MGRPYEPAVYKGPELAVAEGGKICAYRCERVRLGDILLVS